jgi:hypothetical protein
LIVLVLPVLLLPMLVLVPELLELLLLQLVVVLVVLVVLLVVVVVLLQLVVVPELLELLLLQLVVVVPARPLALPALFLSLGVLSDLCQQSLVPALQIISNGCMLLQAFFLCKLINPLSSLHLRWIFREYGPAGGLKGIIEFA